MSILFNKKINKTLIKISMILILISPIIYPQKAEALLGVGDVTYDPSNFFQNSVTAASTAASSVSTLSMQLKEFVLDGLAGMLAKQVIRSITSSVVNWINSGFEGSPSFVQNPGAFFLDIADQATGEFISKNGVLSSLCSPFSIDIKLALAFKYRPNVQKRYACTLSTIIGNTKNAVENASINGFTAGDFKQGGWPAFVSLTTEPQNNVYGAYLTAESELSLRVAGLQIQQKDELSQGKGFLSWKKCIRKSDQAPKVEGQSYTIDSETGEKIPIGGGGTNIDSEKLANDISKTGKAQCAEYETQTPGSVIAGSLENNLGSGIRQLELADEINEIVDALFAQLVTQVLQAGLSGVSKKDASGRSYLDQTVQDLNTENSPQVQKTKADLLANMNTYIANTEKYKKNRDEALNIMLDIKNSYDSVKTCYSGKINNTPQTLTTFQIQTAQSRIAEVDSIITKDISTKTLNLLTLAQEADTRLATLKKIQTDVNSAKTLNDLNGPSQTYTDLAINMKLTNEKNIQDSIADLEQAKSDNASLKQDSLRRLQQCQLFPNDSLYIR